MTISGTTRLAGVMGWPVAHSRSPRLHNFWLAEYGIDGAYVPLAVPPEGFKHALRALPWLGFRGANVTLPHKETAFAIIDRCDDFARRTGAVNTVMVVEDGTLVGRNTDGFGFVESLRTVRRDWRGDAGPAVVLGAGGAARAVIAALQDEGAAEIRLLNRTIGRAEALADQLAPGIIALPWQHRSDALAGAALLVNTTVLGMAGAPPLDIALDALPAAALVADIVYVPRTTPLLAAAQARGLATADGLEMLLHQARPGFAAWFGREPEVTGALRAFVAEGLA